MSFLDRFPGGFIVLANAFVYATVLIETWMLTTGSVVAMGALMALIIALSGVLCRFIMNLMAADDDILAAAPRAAVATVTTIATVPAPERRRAPAHTGAPALS
jgi:hypothetical protein